MANICAFFLCCFAITSNIKTIEPANNQITPIRFVIQLYNEHYVRTLNKLKTLKKHSTHITSADLKNLTIGACNTLKDYQSKLKSRLKLEKKAQDVECSFCVFAKSNISYLKSLVGKLNAGEPYADNEAIVRRLEDEAEIIVKLLLFGNMATNKWLWMYYLKIVAIGQYENDSERFDIDENPLEDDQLQTAVSDFIERCKAEKHLSLTKTQSELVAKNPKVSENMFGTLRASRMFSDMFTGRVVLFTIEFLYLKPFWDDDRLLFGQMTPVNVDWTVAKQRHRVEVAVTREFVENRAWIHKPYGRLDHQHLVVKILDARFLCYLSAVLWVYEKQLTTLGEQTLKHIKVLTNNVLFEVLKFTSFKDDFLMNFLAELQYVYVSDADDIKDILARVTSKANETLDDLNGTGNTGYDWLGFNEHQQFTEDSTTTIIMDFENYLNELKDFLPFGYKVFLHFIGAVVPKRPS